MEKLSRRKLAAFVAAQAKNGTVPGAALQQVAAYLVETGRSRERELVVRAIEDELAARGVVVADVATAHALTDSEKADIKQLLDVETVYFRETVDPALIGGVRVKTPTELLDATVAHKLQALSRAKL